MSREEVYKVFKHIKGLEEEGTLTIKFEDLDVVCGMVYAARNGKYLMIINSRLSYEKQVRTAWHEAKHIYSHVHTQGDVKIFEEEAIEFSNFAFNLLKEVVSPYYSYI